MAIYDAAVVESASISARRNIGGGFSTGGFASGAFDNLGDVFATVSGDLFLSSVVHISSVSELATGTDLIVSQTNVTINVAESATAIVDDIANIVNVNISVIELATVSDIVNAVLDLPVSVSESTQIVLTPLSPRVGFLCLANESAQGSETIGTIVVFTALAEELAVATDDITTIASVTFDISEGIEIVDSVPTNAIYNIPLAESILLSDQVNARLLWEPINTSETTDWVLIDTIN